MQSFRKLCDQMPTNLNQLVFFRPQSKYKVISNTNANKILRNTLSSLGIDSISMHGLRQTHASVLLYHKVSMIYVSERIGYKDVESNRKTYSHKLMENSNEDEDMTTS